MEKNQFNGALGVLNYDPIGFTAAPGGNMLDHPDAHTDGLRRRQALYAMHHAPVNYRMRQGKNQIARPGNF